MGKALPSPDFYQQFMRLQSDVTTLQRMVNQMSQTLAADALQPGVILSGDCALTVLSTSSVQLASGTAWVRNPAGVLVRSQPQQQVIAGIPVAINARLDQIVVDATGNVSWISGADQAGVTLANRTGAAIVQAGYQLLHDLLVTSGGVIVANTRDRRPWARGSFVSALGRTNADYSSTSTAFVVIDGTALSVRLECSGAPIMLGMAGRVFTGVETFTTWFVNGSQGVGEMQVDTASQSSFGGPVIYSPPSAGSYLFQPAYRTTNAATAVSVAGRVNDQAEMWVMEIVRASANNGTS